MVWGVAVLGINGVIAQEDESDIPKLPIIRDCVMRTANNSDVVEYSELGNGRLIAIRIPGNFLVGFARWALFGFQRQ